MAKPIKCDSCGKVFFDIYILQQGQCPLCKDKYLIMDLPPGFEALFSGFNKGVSNEERM